MLNYKIEYYVTKDLCFINNDEMPQDITRESCIKFESFEEAQKYVNQGAKNFVDLDELEKGEKFYSYVLSIELVEDDGTLFNRMEIEEIFEKVGE